MTTQEKNIIVEAAKKAAVEISIHTTGINRFGIVLKGSKVVHKDFYKALSAIATKFKKTKEKKNIKETTIASLRS